MRREREDEEMKGGKRIKVSSSCASMHRVKGYVFQMESSRSIHRHSARHKAENHVSKVREREGGGGYMSAQRAHL